ncbi:hypothetical protein [Rhizobium sp. CSW-27]|uniref:hypothetical protein n=1 Tax=Rhizobium sp. CSW-27 TaxID=2839985 RepID=UPI001C03153D|nr:hypothetical protein [Rhizobium sp. CSW-27]MBT9371788.1 hypothetical protein [Rhizobium sp. CSW-27]
MSIFSAIGSLVGGLFGSKKTTTTSTSYVDYDRMVRDASAAGFNPLTALRNGGSAGFSTTTTTSPTASQIPGALASLGGALGEAFEKKTDPLEQKKRQLDTALVDYQLRQLREGPKAMPGQLYPASQTTGVKVSSFGKKDDGAFIGPPMPEHLKLDKPMPMYVTVIDDNGKRHRMVNPELPDLDQMIVPTIGIVRSEGAQAVTRAPSWWDSWTFPGPKERPAGVPAGQGRWGRYQRP